MTCLGDLISVICQFWVATFSVDRKIGLREQTYDLLTKEMGNSLKKEINYSLPSNTKPIEYSLCIVPNLKKEEYEGTVLIDIEVVNDTNHVVLHSRELQIKNASVSNVHKKGEPRFNSQWKLDQDNDILIIYTTQNLTKAARYRVRVEFKGRMSYKTSFGFVLRTFVNDRTTPTKKMQMASTLLQPIFARKVFPCYDEPQYRAPVSLQIARYAHEKSISNARFLYSTERDPKCDNREWDVFEKSKSIPISNVAFAIFDGDFAEFNLKGKSVEYFVWTTKYAENQAVQVARHAEKTTENMVALTTVKPPSSKMNLVQMQGANTSIVRGEKETRWDSMFYMEDVFLYDEEFCSQKYQQDAVLNISRQISYKWFGEYVFVETWNYPWLKDGFAVYIAYKLNEMIETDWKMADYQGTVEMQKILHHDGRRFTLRLTSTGEPSPKDIIPLYQNQTFETYTGKAALIIRMLEHIVGESNFKIALQNFLKIGHDRENGVIRPDILWEAIQTQIITANVDLKLPSSVIQTIEMIMEPWTTNVGYPLITARLVNDNVVVTQTPFNEHLRSVDESQLEWIVPITIATQTKPDFANTTPCAWSVSDEETVLNTPVNVDEWFVLNVQNTGYYRTNYPISNWKLIVSQLLNDRSAIHPTNRAQLIADSHTLAMNGKLPLSIPLSLSTYLQNEDDPLVWIAALEQFKIYYLALGLNARSMYKHHFLRCLRHEYRRTGFEMKSNDDRLTRIWRSKMLQFLCWFKDVECVEKAESMYRSYGNNLLEIDPDLQYVVLCTVIRQQKDNCGEAVAVNDVSSRVRSGSFKFLCQWKVFNESINCATDQGTYGDLAHIILKESREKGAPSYIEKYMKAILSHWDSTIFVLKSIEYILKSWSVKSPSYAELGGLTNAVRLLDIYGDIAGRPELDMLNEIITIANLLLTNIKYNELKEALSNVRRKAIRTGYHKVNEHVLVDLLEDYRCDEIESYESLKKSTTFEGHGKHAIFIEDPNLEKERSWSPPL